MRANELKEEHEILRQKDLKNMAKPVEENTDRSKPRKSYVENNVRIRIPSEK